MLYVLGKFFKDKIIYWFGNKIEWNNKLIFIGNFYV